MLSRKFERAKRDNPGLSDLLDELMQYLERQQQSGQHFFLPKLAAAKLRLNDGEAYVLLEVLARAGVLTRAFNVYCKKSGALLATVSSEDKLNDIPHCDECDEDHERDGLRLELAFQFPSARDIGMAA
ncbi:hypothetical protein [Granulicella mallensis]|uniref:Uncharacterized protein n=1 Tax=Granulicella mallensis TaxID=940614 RepID=A0A7W8E8A5_9BACT|nr:hypothetical protein [Granulicella mallensis]MBB5062329.1 hypothetical protein [Granulicella mallensis]